MQATTIKLDGEVLRVLQEMKPANQTLTSLVRELLESEIGRRRMSRAAAEYASFLRQHPEEEAEVETWALAPLEQDAAPRARKARR